MPPPSDNVIELRRTEAMVRIAISQAAFEAIASTMPLGSVGYENKPTSYFIFGIRPAPKASAINASMNKRWALSASSNVTTSMLRSSQGSFSWYSIN